MLHDLGSAKVVSPLETQGAFDLVLFRGKMSRWILFDVRHPQDSFSLIRTSLAIWTIIANGFSKWESQPHDWFQFLSFLYSRFPLWPPARTRRWTRSLRRPTPRGTRTARDWASPGTPGCGPRNTWDTGCPGPSGSSRWLGPIQRNSCSNSRWVFGSQI